MHHLLAPYSRGTGVIFTLHHVRPPGYRDPFSPNRILEVTPEFLDTAIRTVLDEGYEIVTLDEVSRRLEERDFKSRFAAFTLDDGYIDNYENALPIFSKYDAPFTVYVTTGLPDGTAVLWWLILESIVRDQDEIEFSIEDRSSKFQTDTTRRKYSAFNSIYWHLRDLPHLEQRQAISDLAEHYDFDVVNLCRSLALSWNDIKTLNNEDLVTIGSHTVNHFALSKLTPEEVCVEAMTGRDIITRNIGNTPVHFSYPYGDTSSAGPREFEILNDLGFRTSTTTRKGVLFREHSEHLQALPRVSLNGDYQHRRYVSLFLSGAPFALFRQFRRLDVR
jgi:peptidoglycan/xylan/chitin deacetylase (PgdA/CDA1 family)